MRAAATANEMLRAQSALSEISLPLFLLHHHRDHGWLGLPDLDVSLVSLSGEMDDSLLEIYK